MEYVSIDEMIKMIKTFIHGKASERDKEINEFVINPYIDVFATQTNTTQDGEDVYIITTIFFKKTSLNEKLRR